VVWVSLVEIRKALKENPASVAAGAGFLLFVPT
jgi:hypothetical protein